jgi:hypothetical protein
MTRLKAGHHITIAGGKYIGRTGTILTINNVCHQVKIDDIGIGWVTCSYCNCTTEAQPILLIRHKDRSSSRLLSSDSPTPQPTLIRIPDMSDSTTTGNSRESRYGSEVTTQVLLNLLAHLTAIMSLDYDHIDD